MVREEPVEPHILPAEQVVQEEDDLDPRIGDDRVLEPMDEIEEVCISETDSTRTVQVGKSLPADIRSAILA